MTIWHSLILGLTEGLTEFLPISSTAHLLLAQKFLGLADSDFLKTFTISIQLGAVLAVVVMSWRWLLTWRGLWLKTLTAFTPTGLLGLAFYKTIKIYWLDNFPLMVLAILAGGLAIIIFELTLRPQVSADLNFDAVSYPKAFLIGLTQCLSFVPGVSRAAATIFGGLSLKINRPTIVAFSFMLAVPTMLAATGLDLLKNAGHFTQEQIWLWLAGFIASFFVAVITVKFFLRFVSRHNFLIFGFYRLALGIWLLTLIK